MYQDTVTIFNRYVSNAGDMWFPKMLKKVDLNIDKASVVRRYGENTADSAILHIAYLNKEGITSIYADNEKEFVYKKPKEWEKQTNDLLSETITFNDGLKFDFMFAGEWPDLTPINDNEYINGFYNFMNKNYDDVYAITSVSKFSVIPHFEITCK